MRTVLALAAVLTLSAGAAAAQGVPAGGLAPPEVAAWLTARGLTPEVTETESGALIEVEADNLGWSIAFYDCQGGRCPELQFTSGFTNATITEPMVNAWNAERRYLKAFYIADGPAAVVQHDLRLVPAPDLGQLDASLELWRAMLPDFAVHVGYFVDPGAEAAPPAQ